MPRRWHRLVGRHVQITRASSPMIYGGWQGFTITCSCGCSWDVVR